MKIENIPLNRLAANTGQIEGLPKNPRKWDAATVEALAASIQETPELLEARPPIVVPHGGKYVVLGGNLRLEACKSLGFASTPCCVLPEATPADKLKEIVIKDNGSFGDWDTAALAEDWGALPLEAWGVPAWEVCEAMEGGANDSDETDGYSGSEKELNPEAEALLDAAMQENCREFIEQVDLMLAHGWLATGYTVGFAKQKFLRALYYGERYPQATSFVFQPHRFLTAASDTSVYAALKRAGAEGKAGISGARTASADGNLLLLLKSGYPIASGRIPLDFPSDKAKDLIEEFCVPGGDILDPCHGWGGRYIGALLAGVGSYTGVDPCEATHNGLERIREAFSGYCPRTRRADFILAPFEDCSLPDNSFDFAITSPPYFDVEKYEGANQAHRRYPKYALWRDGFYSKLISRTFRYLRPGCVFALQVGSQSYPLATDGKAIAEKVGFIVEEVRSFGGMTSSGLHPMPADNENNEKFIILRKPK